VNYDIHYLTSYRYAAPVTDNLNALRVRPATTSNQRCDDFHVRLDPEARVHRHVDYFGTEVLEFGIARPHEALSIDVQAYVATEAPPPPPEPSWEQLQGTGYRDAGAEFLMPSDGLPEATIDDLLAELRASSPLAAVRLVCELIPDRFEYRPGSTYVGSTVADLLSAGAGVCQDFVHLALVLLRRRGIAARYVSGYLWAAPPGADEHAESLEVQTHAWIEALLPPVGGDGDPVWVGADPTNRGLAGEAHVKIGHGRSYADVPPIRGVYRGAADAELEARVEMRKLN
jgi:transglutaminase-like putative cysteine protease